MLTFLIVLLLALPLLLYGRFMDTFKNTKKDRVNLVLNKALDRVIKKNSLSINEMDLFNNKIIGLDQNKYKLILIEHENKNIRADCISLTQAKSCNFHKEINEFTGRVEKIIINLTFSPGNKPIDFTLYDATKENIYELPFLLGKAKYWKSRIQLYIHNTSPELKLGYLL